MVAAEGTCGGSAAANVAEAVAAADEDVVEVVEAAGPGDFGASLTGGGCTGSY